jgi:tight adherence protein B
LSTGLILASAAVALLVMAVAGDLALRPRRKQKAAVAGRIREIGTIYARSKGAAATASGVRLAKTVRGPALLRRVALLFAYDPMHRDWYAAPWWLVMAGAALPAWIVAMLLRVLLGNVAITTIPVLWLVICRLLFVQLESRHRKKLYRQFPDALGTIVRAVRVGIPVAEGMRMVGRDAQLPTSREFSRLADRIGMGLSIEDALRDMAEATALPEYRFFATAIALQTQTGGALAETLDGLGDVVRRRVAMEARGQALAGEAKMSIYILSVLPGVACVMLSVLQPDYVAPLLYDHYGNMILAAAILTVVVGFVTMQTIIRKSLS